MFVNHCARHRRTNVNALGTDIQPIGFRQCLDIDNRPWGVSRRTHLYEHIRTSGQNLRLPPLTGVLRQQSNRL
jgi:hypothetical protein